MTARESLRADHNSPAVGGTLTRHAILRRYRERWCLLQQRCHAGTVRQRAA